MRRGSTVGVPKEEGPLRVDVSPTGRERRGPLGLATTPLVSTW